MNQNIGNFIFSECKGVRLLHSVKLIAILVSLLCSYPAILRAAAAHSVETKIFPIQPEDVLIIHNDYGRVQIRTWENPELQARIWKIAVDDSQLDNVAVISEKRSHKLFFKSYFYDYRAESVYIEIQAPKFVNVVVWGANPAVEISGIEGYVRVHTLTGLITGEDLISSVSLLSEQGDILFRSRLQPKRDVRLESVYGDILCDLREGLNLRGWARAGGTLSWNREVELESGSLEKQVGTGGPLLYAGSLSGNVQLRFTKFTTHHIPDQGSSMEELTGDTADPAAQTHRTSSPAKSAPHSAGQSTAAATADAENEEPWRTSGSGDERPPIDRGYALKVNVDWVYLNVSVRDRYANRSVADLQKDDFLVYENETLQNVEHLQSTEAPFDLLLLLDISGSTRSHMRLIKKASIGFIGEIKPNDRIAVATFNSRTRLIQDFTNDRHEAAKAIEQIRSGGGTAFYDALDTSIDDYMRGREGRKAIVVFTDGVDNQLTGDYANGSHLTFGELFREIQEIETIIYTIFLDTERDNPSTRRRRTGSVIDILGDIIRGRTPPYNPRIPGRDGAYEEARKQLHMIADQTGGRMYSPWRIEDLSGVYSEIADDLRIQYRLGYTSSNPVQDGSWRKIRVKIKNRPNAVARTRKGYYARRG